jgi:phosphatidylserine decarboxylase
VRVPLHWRAFIALMKRLPQSGFSRVFGHLTDIRLPRSLRRFVLSVFARAVGIEIADAEKDLAEYPSVGDFFVRRLKPGLRPMPEDERAIVSPVDGQLGAFGMLDGVRMIQAKGIHYSVEDVVDDAHEAGRFINGAFITIYLSPKDYHRIHAPYSGTIGWARHIPGCLLPVNRPAVAFVPDLFARNERVLCLIEAEFGNVAVVAVGALNVGRISSAFDPQWNGKRGGVSNRPGAKAETRRYDPPIEITRGDELMAFHLGSTIVLLFEPNKKVLREDLKPGQILRFGEALASQQ